MLFFMNIKMVLDPLFHPHI